MTITRNTALLLVCIATLLVGQQAHSQQDQVQTRAAAGASVEALAIEIAAIESTAADYRRLQALAAPSIAGPRGE